MKPDHVTFRVINESDKAVLSDGLFWLLNSSAVPNRAGHFDRAVTAGKINRGFFVFPNRGQTQAESAPRQPGDVEGYAASTISE